MQPQEIFKDQPVVVPAGMVHAIWQFIGSKPAAETAWLVVQFQQFVGPQMKQIEDAVLAAAATGETAVAESTTVN